MYFEFKHNTTERRTDLGIAHPFFVLIFRCVSKIAKSDYYLRLICPSVHPDRTTQLSLDGFSSNLIFEYFSKIFHENSSLIKI